MAKILVSGSIAYDRIMDFPGYFKDHIMPDKIHSLNVCFTVERAKEGFGGTAGNIAYGLSLLGEKPILLGVVGKDFAEYKKWLKKHSINATKVKEDKKELTATAYVMTDQSDNQITGFYRGPSDDRYCQVIKQFADADLAIISPDAETRMLGYTKLCRKLNIPFVADPGQQLSMFKPQELKELIFGAKIFIGNDYEIESTLRRLKMTRKSLEKKVGILVITKGSKGAEIYQAGKKINIPPAKPKNTCDPTGAGDAFRSGFVKGLLSGYSLEVSGRLGSVVAVYTVEKYGTQTHRFTWKEVAKRYRDNFHEKL